MAENENEELDSAEALSAKFPLGQIVRHRRYPFRGVIFDVDPTFANTEEWWLSIPEEVRPRKDQPYYHLFAENAETTYIAYVSEQNLLVDETRQARAPSRCWQLVRRYGKRPLCLALGTCPLTQTAIA